MFRWGKGLGGGMAGGTATVGLGRASSLMNPEAHATPPAKAAQSNIQVLGATPETPNSGLSPDRIKSALSYNNQIKFNAHAVPTSLEKNSATCILGKNIKAHTQSGDVPITVKEQLEKLLEHAGSENGVTNIVQFTSKRSLNHGSAAQSSRESKFPPLSAELTKINRHEWWTSKESNPKGTPPFIKYTFALGRKTINLIEIAPDFDGGIMKEDCIKQTVDTLANLGINQSNIHCMLSPGGIGRPSIIHAALQLKAKANENNNTNETVNEVVENIETLRPQYISVKRSASRLQQNNLEAYFEIAKKSQSNKTEHSELTLVDSHTSPQLGPNSIQAVRGMTGSQSAPQLAQLSTQELPGARSVTPIPTTDPKSLIPTYTNSFLNSQTTKTLKETVENYFGKKLESINKITVQNLDYLYNPEAQKPKGQLKKISGHNNMCWLNSAFFSVCKKFNNKADFVNHLMAKVGDVDKKAKSKLENDLSKVYEFHINPSSTSHKLVAEVNKIQFNWILLAIECVCHPKNQTHIDQFIKDFEINDDDNLLENLNNQKTNNDLEHRKKQDNLEKLTKELQTETIRKQLVAIKKHVDHDKNGDHRTNMYGATLHIFLELNYKLYRTIGSGLEIKVNSNDQEKKTCLIHYDGHFDVMHNI